MVYLHSNLCSALQKTHFSATECVLAVQGHMIKSALCDFLLVIDSRPNYGPILHRFWDTATYWLKIAYFPHPTLTRRPRSLCSLWNFALKLTVRKLESWGYPPVKTHDRRLSGFDMISECDRETVGPNLLYI